MFGIPCLYNRCYRQHIYLYMLPFFLFFLSFIYSGQSPFDFQKCKGPPLPLEIPLKSTQAIINNEIRCLPLPSLLFPPSCRYPCPSIRYWYNNPLLGLLQSLLRLAPKSYSSIWFQPGHLLRHLKQSALELQCCILLCFFQWHCLHVRLTNSLGSLRYLELWFCRHEYRRWIRGELVLRLLPIDVYQWPSGR